MTGYQRRLCERAQEGDLWSYGAAELGRSPWVCRFVLEIYMSSYLMVMIVMRTMCDGARLPDSKSMESTHFRIIMINVIKELPKTLLRELQRRGTADSGFKDHHHVACD